jgi:hypothetical protein
MEIQTDMKTLIEKIEEGQKVEFFTEPDGRRYANKVLFPMYGELPDKISLYTLSGLVEFVKWEALENCAVHVCDFDNVEIMSNIIPPFAQRPVYASAKFVGIDQFFDNFLDIEKFIIALQSHFIQDDNTEAILKILGNVSNGIVGSYVDDGISQKVILNAGVTSKVSAKVPNPVILQPYRTFLEVEQPASKFILRLKGTNAEERPTVGLFQADGGAWHNEARMNIKKYFNEQLPEIPCIA